MKRTSQTAQGREGCGYADAKDYNPEPESKRKTKRIYTSSENDVFYKQRKRIVQLEKLLNEGGATEKDIEELENLAYMLYKGPFGC